MGRWVGVVAEGGGLGPQDCGLEESKSRSMSAPTNRALNCCTSSVLNQIVISEVLQLFERDRVLLQNVFEGGATMSVRAWIFR